MDLALDNLQRLICHKTQTNKQTPFDIAMFLHKTTILFYHTIILPHLELLLPIQLQNLLSGSTTLDQLCFVFRLITSPT